MSLSLQAYFWRAVLKRLLKGKRMSIEEHRASGKQNARLLGALPVGTTLEPVEFDGLPAEWIIPAPGGQKKVILYLHGGGYVTGSLETYRMLCSLLAECSGAKVLVTDYRLAPEHPFPAALDDALKAYGWLLANGCAAEDILIAGDSAGGGLSIATTLALRDQQIALPAGVMCFSPWTDLALRGQTHTTRAKSEVVLNTDVLREWSLAYTTEANFDNPLVSPVYGNFNGFPPLFIQVGSDEILLDDALLLAETARSAGVKVELNIWNGMWHVWQALGKMIPENHSTFDEIGVFAKRTLKI